MKRPKVANIYKKSAFFSKNFPLPAALQPYFNATRCKSTHCKRPSFASRLTAFYNAKHGILQDKRPPFAIQVRSMQLQNNVIDKTHKRTLISQKVQTKHLQTVLKLRFVR